MHDEILKSLYITHTCVNGTICLVHCSYANTPVSYNIQKKYMKLAKQTDSENIR